MVSTQDNKSRLSSYVLLTLLLLAASLDAKPLHIGKVSVEPLDVYSSNEKQAGAFYRLADRFHIETRRHVIEKFLLFREGDVFEPERLAETERNLRALGFLKSASVTASAPHDGVVDVRVVTQDSWSIAPETQAGSRGGKSTYGATISETNLLGLGKDIELGWNKGVDRRQIALNYNDPAFFAPYLKAHFGYAHTSDGFNRQINVRRPFFSFATAWAAESSFSAFRQDSRLYRDGVEVSRFEQSHREIAASYGIALNPNDRYASRVTLGFRTVDDDFATISGHDGFEHMREFRYLLARYEYGENDFLKLNFVNKDLRFEDFNLGRHVAVEAAVSPIDSTSEFVSVRGGSGLRLGDDAFIMPSFGVSTRLASGFQNMISNANLLYVNRQGGDAYPLTTVGHVTFNSGWRMDPELQFFADGLGGLRGYRAHSFAGSRSIVINLEERLYLGRELMQLASPGVVAFIDAGNATNGGFGDLMRLKSDIGVGIRIGLPRTPKNLLRVDFAYALNRDAQGRRGLLVSFSSGQAF